MKHELAVLAAWLHDIGKFSKEFQHRILDGGPKVDHSTAGAYEAFSAGRGAGVASLLAYCIAGHHGGLPDGGHRGDDVSKGTLYAKLSRAENHLIPDYSDWSSDTLQFPPNPPLSMIGSAQDQKFTLSFFTRMLFSCLVDADYLCTERFMNGKTRARLLGSSPEELRDLLEPCGHPLNPLRRQPQPVEHHLTDSLSRGIEVCGVGREDLILPGPQPVGHRPQQPVLVFRRRKRNRPL